MHLAVATAASTLMAVGTLAFAPVASAAPTATTTTVMAPATLKTGDPASIVAKVTPFKIGKAKIHGAVAFTITGSDGSTIACKGTPMVDTTGRAVCKVAEAQFKFSSSPYTVSAVYAGDAVFASSTSNTISIAVTQRSAYVVLKISPRRPTSGVAATVTATVKAGPGSALVTGEVLFAVATSNSADHTQCTGGDLIAITNDAAVCNLAPGWFKVPSRKKVLHPKATWTITAVYKGDVNFPATGKAAVLRGYSHH